MMRPAGKKRADGSIGRRELLHSVAALCLLQLPTACGPSAAAAGGPARPAFPPHATATARGPFGGAVEVWSWFDLPDDPRSRELSGIAWDEAARTLWARAGRDREHRSARPRRRAPGVGLRSRHRPEDVVPARPRGHRRHPGRLHRLEREGPARPRGRSHRKAAPRHPAARALLEGSRQQEPRVAQHEPRRSLPVHDLGGGVELRRRATPPRRRARASASSASNRDGGEPEEHVYTTDPLPHDGGDYGVADLARSRRTRSSSSSAAGRAAPETPHASIASASPIPKRAASPCRSSPPTCAVLAEAAPRRPREAPRERAARSEADAGVAAARQLRGPRGRAPSAATAARASILVSDDNARSDQFARIVVLAVG